MMDLYNHLLKAPGKSVSEIAEIIYGVAGTGPVDQALEVYDASGEMIGATIYSHLDFERFKSDDGKFVKTILAELERDAVTDTVSHEYEEYIGSLDLEALVRDAEEQIVKRIERFIWLNGIRNVSEAVSLAERNITECASQYAALQAEADSSALDKSYADALKMSLAERLLNTNDEDILVYRNDLIEYLETVCSNIRYSFWERFFSILSCSSVFTFARVRIDELTSILKASGATGQVSDDDSFNETLPDDDAVVFLDSAVDAASALAKVESVFSALTGRE